MTTLWVIGAGMGHSASLTGEALAAGNSCKTLYAFDRLGQSLQNVFPHVKIVSYTALMQQLEQGATATVGVLVSGDVGFFSLGHTLQKTFASKYQLQFACGISSLQFLCAKLQLPTTAVNVTSLHGRQGCLLGSIAYNQYSFALIGGTHTAQGVLKSLCNKGLGAITVTAGQRLSAKDESLQTGTIAQLATMEFDSLTVLLFQNTNPANKNAVLFDHQLKRGKAPMTKQEIRWTSIAYLNIQPQDIVYDIGAGTGSVSIEMGRKAFGGSVYALEQKEETYQLLCQNRNNLGAYNVQPLLGKATSLLATLPPPNKVFIGGSGRELPQLLPALYQKNPKLQLVLTAVTLDTLTQAVQLLTVKEIPFTVTCVNTAHSKPLGTYTMLQAQNPVYIIATTQKENQIYEAEN